MTMPTSPVAFLAGGLSRSSASLLRSRFRFVRRDVPLPWYCLYMAISAWDMGLRMDWAGVTRLRGLYGIVAGGGGRGGGCMVGDTVERGVEDERGCWKDDDDDDEGREKTGDWALDGDEPGRWGWRWASSSLWSTTD